MKKSTHFTKEVASLKQKQPIPTVRWMSMLNVTKIPTHHFIWVGISMDCYWFFIFTKSFFIHGINYLSRTHKSIVHEHNHTDGHHNHSHTSKQLIHKKDYHTHTHTHTHVHEPIEHTHPHSPNIHHRYEH